MNASVEPSEAQSLVQEIDRAVVLTAASFAEHVGVSYDSWRSWRIGRRNPSHRNLLRLAAALESKAETIKALASRASHLAHKYSSANSARSTA
jgi:DNA-binding transcriptional regulator YiaG